MDPVSQPDADGTGQGAGTGDTAAGPAPHGAEATAGAGDARGAPEPTVEIDGQAVPLSEVIRWRDTRKHLEAEYTRKFQALSEERRQIETAQALYEALQTDPEALEYLRTRWTGKAPAAAPGSGPAGLGTPADRPPSFGDPEVDRFIEGLWGQAQRLAAQVDQLQRAMLTREEREEDARLEQELAAVRAEAERLGLPAFDEDAVLAYMEEHEIPSVRAAYLELHGLDKLAEAIITHHERTRAAGRVGRSEAQTAGGTPAAEPAPKPKTLEEATARAVERLFGAAAAAQVRRP